MKEQDISDPTKTFVSVVHVPSEVNPCELSISTISTQTEQTQINGPKLCVSVKPSRMDMFCVIQIMSKQTYYKERAGFADCAVGRIDKLMGKTCSDEKRIFHVITTAERKVERILLQLLRTDKNGMLGILQEEVLGKRSEDVLKRERSSKPHREYTRFSAILRKFSFNNRYSDFFKLFCYKKIDSSFNYSSEHIVH